MFTENKQIYIPLCPGDIAILSISLSLDSILTCVSTGGPATNVTWTRDNDEVNLILVHLLDNAHVTVLGNAITAQYSHTLNVTGTDLPAVYGCSVSNNKPSSAKAIASIVLNAQVFQNKTYIAHELFSLFLSLYTCMSKYYASKKCTSAKKITNHILYKVKMGLLKTKTKR